MGMYTGLRVDVVLKPKFVTVINELYVDRENERDPWAHVAEKFPQYPWLKEWSNIGRATFIPFGSLCYMGDWKEDNTWLEVGSKECLKGHNWKFQCSLKNYEFEIETFLFLVLKEITEEQREVYYKYEEWAEPTYYDLKAGCCLV